MVRYRLRITGRVQNVFFRDWTVEQARTLGLDGWVRNRADSSVEALIAGPREQADQLVARVHEGPPAARVEAVSVEDDDTPETLSGFEKRPTR